MKIRHTNNLSSFSSVRAVYSDVSLILSNKESNLFQHVFVICTLIRIMPPSHVYCIICLTHQAFDHLQQFLHHHSDALVA